MRSFVATIGATIAIVTVMAATAAPASAFTYYYDGECYADVPSPGPRAGWISSGGYSCGGYEYS